MDKLKLEFNKPMRGELKFGSAKRGESKIPGKGDWFMYTLKSGEVLFVDSDDCQDPDEMFAAANIGANDPFTICLRKSRQGARYLEVKALSDAQGPELDPSRYPDELGNVRRFAIEPPSALEAQLAASIPFVQQRKASPSKATPTAVATVPEPAKPFTVPTQTPNFTIHHTGYSRTMAAAMIAAIDAAREAERYAKACGFPLEFETEDIRCIASTLFIQASKDPAFLTQPTQKVNGGTQQWPA